MTHKVQIKLFLREPHDLAPRDFVPVLHAWIQTHRLAELAIDVADYAHVHHGPGVVLLCDAANYALDQGGGRLGLLYTRKRARSGTPVEHLRAALAAVLAAAVELEADPGLAGRVAFATDELVIRVNDRLIANDAAGHSALRGLAAGLAEDVFTGCALDFELASGDPRELLGLRLRARGAPAAEVLLERLTAAA